MYLRRGDYAMGGEVERGTYEYDGGFNYITHRRSVKIISFSD